MRNWLRVATMVALATTVVTACTMKNANASIEKLMRLFQAGQPMLDCSVEECGLGWIHNLPNAAASEAAGRWQELALSVMRIGCLDDLRYYYLGRAAENLGYLQAAQCYYRIAGRLSVNQMACNKPQVEVNICNAYIFPDALYPHLEVVEARLAAVSTPAAASGQTRTRRAVRRQVPQASTSPATAAGPNRDTGISCSFEPRPQPGFCRALAVGRSKFS